MHLLVLYYCHQLVIFMIVNIWRLYIYWVQDSNSYFVARQNDYSWNGETWEQTFLLSRVICSCEEVDFSFLCAQTNPLTRLMRLPSKVILHGRWLGATWVLHDKTKREGFGYPNIWTSTHLYENSTFLSEHVFLEHRGMIVEWHDSNDIRFSH